jgi:Protein of Unknown function (DUF2784)
MTHALLADAVLVLHGLFIVWAVLGGLAVLWRGVLAWLHLPAALWGVWIEWSGRLCPLTPLEQSLRRAAGQGGFEGGFIDHYLTAVIYPEGLTREMQWLFGAIVLVINLVLYAIAGHRVISRHRSKETAP